MISFSPPSSCVSVDKYVPDLAAASLPLGTRLDFSAGTRGERSTFLIRSNRKSYPERSSKLKGLFSQTLQLTRSARRFVVPVNSPWHEYMRTSTLSLVQNGTTMVRILHHSPPPSPRFQSLLPQQITWKSNGTSQVGMKLSAGSVVESTQRFDNSGYPSHSSY